MAVNAELVDYIRRAAQARGIDPDVAVRVARSEGGLSNPFRHGEGPAPKSQAAGFGATENSYGPFQLYVSGTGAGLGDRAMRAGIDPSKDWQKGIDFALDEVTRKGWGQWYGAKGQGITGMMGVGGKPAPEAAVQPAPQYASSGGGPGGGTRTGETPSDANMSGPTPAAQYASSGGGPGGGTRTGEVPSTANNGVGQTMLAGGLPNPAAAVTAKKPEQKNWRDLLASAMAGYGKGSGAAQAAPRMDFTPQTAPSVALQAQPLFNPNDVNNQRQQMAAALARLNSGQLYG